MQQKGTIAIFAISETHVAHLKSQLTFVKNKCRKFTYQERPLLNMLISTNCSNLIYELGTEPEKANYKDDKNTKPKIKV